MSRCVMVALAARVVRSGGVGFEPHGAEVVSCHKTYVRVQGGGQATQQRDGRLGSALFDALDLINSHLNPPGRLEDAETEGAALVIHGPAAKARAARMAICSGSSACSGGRTQRVW